MEFNFVINFYSALGFIILLFTFYALLMVATTKGRRLNPFGCTIWTTLGLLLLY